MKEQFNLYAQYYDLLYKDKEYKKEAEYLHSLIQKYHPDAKTILSLGCGTGKYEFELEKLGYTITGVDLSQQMIDIANNDKDESKCKFIQDDIRSLRLRKKFDIVVSLFHILSYQNSEKDITAFFNTAKQHLKTNGIFIFDFWHGPAVLADPPTIRRKFIENKKISIDRTATPKKHEENNIIDVNYEIIIVDKETQKQTKFKEVHSMRYFFDHEIIENAKKISFKPQFSFNENWGKTFIFSSKSNNFFGKEMT